MDAVAGDHDRAEIVLDRFVLATQRQRAKVGVAQADIRQAAEQATVLRCGAGHHVEAVLQIEDGLGAAAQIFLAAEADTRILIGAAQGFQVMRTALVGEVADAAGNQTVNFKLALCMRLSASQHCWHCDCADHPLLHHHPPGKY